MVQIFEGLKVVEAAEWVMAPTTTAVLAAGGADVIKVEHPVRGDGMRANIRNMGFPTGEDPYDYYIEQVNHSKRSLGLDFSHPQARDVLLRLIAEADVFVTSFTERARTKWGINADVLREANPRLIYASTSGQGVHGEGADDPGFDITTYWSRSGLAGQLARGTERPPFMPSGGFGDVQAGLSLAGGIAAALYRRSVTGEGMTVDVSLLGSGVWANLEVLQVADVLGIDARIDYRPNGVPKNPLVRSYRTADDRWIQLNMMDSDRYWPRFCAAIGAEDLVTDPRFSTFYARNDNAELAAEEIARAFARLGKEEAIQRLREGGAAHALISNPFEVLEDPQVIANEMLSPHPTRQGRFVVAPPFTFGGQTLKPRDAAPETGQHTEEILLEAGYTWDDIISLKTDGVVN